MIGGLTTVINYTAFIGGIRLGIHYILAATESTAITVFAGYFLHRTFTFSVARQPNIREFLGFIGVFLLQYGFSVLDYVMLIGYLGVGPSTSFVINSSIMAAVSFTVLQRFTFRERRSPVTKM